MKSRKETLYRAAQKKFGTDGQMVKAAEEFSEAASAVLRVWLNPTRKSKIALVDELADIEVMNEQMQLFMNLKRAVKARKQIKLNLLRARLQ